MPISKPFPSLQDLALNAIVKTPFGLFSPEILSMRKANPSRDLAEMGVVDQIIHQQVTKSFLQAVIDDDRETVTALLETNPQLLMIDLPENFVIESQYTGQQFFAEPALMMAVKRKQIKMIELLLHFFDKLEQTEAVLSAKAQALSAWKACDIQQNAAGQDEIVIPDGYQARAEALVACFENEPLPLVELSEETQLALEDLLDELLPDAVISLEDYPDLELFLLAVYKAYYDHYHTLIVEFGKAITEDRAEQFCKRVIGLLQRVLPPETAKMLCQGLHQVMNNGAEIGERAESLTLVAGGPYYRKLDDNRRGFGFSFVCNHKGSISIDALHPEADDSFDWMKFVVKKERDFQDIQFSMRPRLGLKK